MKFDRLKGKSLLSNSRCFATRYTMILLNSSVLALENYDFAIFNNFVSSKTFFSKVRIESHLFWDDS